MFYTAFYTVDNNNTDNSITTEFLNTLLIYKRQITSSHQVVQQPVI